MSMSREFGSNRGSLIASTQASIKNCGSSGEDRSFPLVGGAERGVESEAGFEAVAERKRKIVSAINTSFLSVIT